MIWKGRNYTSEPKKKCKKSMAILIMAYIWQPYHFWYNLEIPICYLWICKQWGFLTLIVQSLNIAIIQLHSKQSKAYYKVHKNYSVEGDFCNSAKTVLYFFLLMLYKVSPCKIFDEVMFVCLFIFFFTFCIVHILCSVEWTIQRQSIMGTIHRTKINKTNAKQN